MDFLRQFSVDEHGVIQSPGKFEGEPIYVPYYWEMDGEDDEIIGNDKLIRIFYVGEWEASQFPELSTSNVVYLWEDELGFIHSYIRREEIMSRMSEMDIERKNLYLNEIASKMRLFTGKVQLWSGGNFKIISRETAARMIVEDKAVWINDQAVGKRE